MMSVNILEAIRFYVSFACSFAFAERNIMEGNAKIIRLIARDEQLHLSGTQHILRLMRTGVDDIEFASIASECEEECVQMFNEAAQQEKDWASYLFKDGGMVGLNENIICQYVDFITNQRMKYVGLKPSIEGNLENPIPWINTWLSSDSVAVAPQETEISSYLSGQVDSDMSNEDFEDFSL